MDDLRQNFLSHSELLERFTSTLDHPAIREFQRSADRISAEFERLNGPLMQRAEEMRRVFEGLSVSDHSAKLRQLLESSGVEMMRTGAAERLALLAKELPIPTYEPPNPIDYSALFRDVEPEPRRPNAAVETLQRIQERLHAEKAEKEDARHIVAIVVTLFDGAKVVALDMYSDGDTLIRVVGTDMATLTSRDVTLAVDTLQFEFVTLDKPPPNLRVVK
jgi:hypothetical protein